MKKKNYNFNYISDTLTLLFLFTDQLIFSQELNYLIKPIAPPQNQFNVKSDKVIKSDFNKPFIQKESAFSFSKSVQVNIDSGNQINEFAPVVEVSKEGIIYVVWNGDESVKSIYFSRSLDGGKTFSSPIKINDDVIYPLSYSVYQPDIALDKDDNIYIVWHDYRGWYDDQSWTSPIDIYLDKSTDNGITWGIDTKVSSGFATYPWHFQPSIAIDKNNDNIYVSYTDYDRYYPQGDLGDVSVSSSLNRGESFEDKVRVDNLLDSILVMQSFSSIAVDSVSGVVYVAFDDTRNESKDIYLSKSTDFGQSFIINTLVNIDTTNDQEEPSVKTDKSGNVYVVWKDWKSDPSAKESPYLNDIYIAKSTDYGNSFSAGVRINDEYLDAEYSYNFPPRLAIDNFENVHVTWFDFRYGYTNCFYDESIDGGQTFGMDVIVNDNRDSLSHSLPSIAVDNKNGVYIVWMDKRNENNMYDIFFSNNTELTNINESALFPSDFTLYQNYPNPFNPSTKIRYSIPRSTEYYSVPQKVTLKVYDVLGNEVATLVDEYREAGNYEIDFNVGRPAAADSPALSSGIYFYQLQAGSYSQTKSMILIK